MYTKCCSFDYTILASIIFLQVLLLFCFYFSMTYFDKQLCKLTFLSILLFQSLYIYRSHNYRNKTLKVLSILIMILSLYFFGFYWLDMKVDIGG